jgi:hypothetical protein
MDDVLSFLSSSGGQLSLVVLVLWSALAILSRIYGRSQWEAFIPATILALLIWIPEGVRDFIILGLTLLIAFASFHNGFAVATTMVIAGVLTFAVPGGASVLVLAIGALAGIWAFRDSWAHLRAMKRARTLKPGERPSGVVQLVGEFAEQRLVALPGKLLERDRETNAEHSLVVGWQLSFDDRSFASARPMRLFGDYGVALIDPGALLSDESHGDVLDGDAARQALRDLGVSAAPKGSVELRWIELGDPGYVRGIPSWEADSQGVGYRSSPMVPVFRQYAASSEKASQTSMEPTASEPAEGPQLPEPIAHLELTSFEQQQQLYVANHSLQQILTTMRYQMWTWPLITVACVAVVVVQLVAH